MEENRAKNQEDWNKHVKEMTDKRKDKLEKVDQTLKSNLKTLKQLADIKNADRAARREDRIKEEKRLRKTIWDNAREELRDRELKEIERKKEYDLKLN